MTRVRLATCTALLALAAGLPSGAAAQRRAAADAPPHVWTAAPVAPATPISPPASAQDGGDPRQGAMLAGGLWGGLVGGVLGLGMGLAADDMGAAYFGTTAGVAAGMAAGAHHGNRQAGSLPPGMLASVGWSLVLAALALESDAVPLLAAAPVGSLLLSMTVEERTGRER